jgi:protoporphyrinogen oxidase
MRRYVLKKVAVIIGAGPAGLTAAYELLAKTDIKPVIFEATGDIGGISKTVNYKGNRIDIGGHRFFSKSDKIMKWWLTILPLQGRPSKDDIILEKTLPLSELPDAPDPEKTDAVMLIRNRISRILYLRKFFSYPVTMSLNTLLNLGIIKTIKIGVSYIASRVSPIKNEASLEDFFINRFGRELYQTFFKSYTEKVWGVPCSDIQPEWGAQRIKGLSVGKLIVHRLKQMVSKVIAQDSSIAQKNTETSLIERFMYPKFGPGQMWEDVSRIIRQKGGEIYLEQEVTDLMYENDTIRGVQTRHSRTGDITVTRGDYFFSTMPVKDLITSLGAEVPTKVQHVAGGLMYRDFITVGLLLKKLKLKNEMKTRTVNNIIPDNWIYIQEPDATLGRLQIFNNWSPYLVKDDKTVWIGLEYFCNEGDALWNKPDDEFIEFAIDDLAAIDVINKKDVLDGTIIRMKKTYPAYFGSYNEFSVIQEYINRFENLFLIGRNGMHRYNNQDHSMLTAMTAVENIINGITLKDNIWGVNTEEEYHEVKNEPSA